MALPAATASGREPWRELFLPRGQENVPQQVDQGKRIELGSLCWSSGAGGSSCRPLPSRQHGMQSCQDGGVRWRILARRGLARGDEAARQLCRATRGHERAECQERGLGCKRFLRLLRRCCLEGLEAHAVQRDG
ncbi:unnamed protein product, partial [Symbiodinium microadriaticum]